MPISPLRIAVVLGVLSAIGSLAIDMYLPALPSIGQSLVSDGSPLIMLGGIAACSITALVLATGPWGVTHDCIRTV